MFFLLGVNLEYWFFGLIVFYFDLKLNIVDMVLINILLL